MKRKNMLFRVASVLVFLLVVAQGLMVHVVLQTYHCSYDLGCAGENSCEAEGFPVERSICHFICRDGEYQTHLICDVDI